MHLYKEFKRLDSSLWRIGSESFWLEFKSHNNPNLIILKHKLYSTVFWARGGEIAEGSVGDLERGRDKRQTGR